MAKDDNPTTEHLEAVSDQVQTQHGDSEQESGPDPIIEITGEDKAQDEPERDDDFEPTGLINPEYEEQREEAHAKLQDDKAPEDDDDNVTA